MARLLVLLFVFGVIGYVLLRTVRSLKGLAGGQKEETKQSDPHTILGISQGASETEIKEAYHRELSKYHPDKVAHLGTEIQTVAQQKTVEIIRAYEAINKCC